MNPHETIKTIALSNMNFSKSYNLKKVKFGKPVYSEFFSREDLKMKKIIFLFFFILLIMAIVWSAGSSSWCRQDLESQKEETKACLATNIWTDLNEYVNIQEKSDENNLIDHRIIILTGIVDKQGENVLKSKTRIMITEIENSLEKPQYEVQVDLNSKYIDSQKWELEIIEKAEEYPSGIKITEGQIGYKETSSESGLLSRIVKRSIEGRFYCIELVSDGAAGTIYTQYIYSTLKKDNLITVSCVIQYPQCMNYSEPHRTECVKECESFDLDRIISNIVENLSVKKIE